MEPLLSLPPDQFRAALAELQLDPQREADLVRQYRRANSPLAPIYGLLDRVSGQDAGQGMQRASMVPVARPEGMSVAEAVRSGEARLAVPQGVLDAIGALVGGIDAPGAAARGLLPAQDMPAEALGTAGVAMGGGGLLSRPAGSVGMGGRVAGDDYRGVHRAPGRTDDGSTASIDNLTAIYPDDIYDVRVAPRYYGHMTDPVSDRQMIELFSRLRGRPDVGVPVYRAVPIDAPDELNPGDWVTPSRRYAEGHGESALGGEYRIIEGNVPARELYTDANSIFEFGWSPELSVNRSTTAGLLASAAETPAQRVARLLREGRASEVTDNLMAQADPQEMYRLYVAGETGMDLPMDEASRMARAREMGFNVPSYHSTDANIRAVDNERLIGGQFWSTDDVGAINRGEVGAAGRGVVLPLQIRQQNPAGWRQYDQLGVDEMIGRGYDSMRLPESDGTNTFVTFDPQQVRSRFARFDPRLSHLANLNAANVSPIAGLLAILQAQEQQR